MYRNDSDDDTSQVTAEEFDESLAPLKSEVEWTINSLTEGKSPGLRPYNT